MLALAFSSLTASSFDPGWIEELFRTIAGVAPGWVYLAIAIGAAIENIFPPIPADTFVLFGAFLSAHGPLTATGVFLATWSSNIASALMTYAIARRWGQQAFDTSLGRFLLRPRQLERLAALYDAHGGKIIFGSRFLPAFRSLVPVFAGISRLGFWRTALPVALASGIWYGVLVYVGAMFGRNWQVILDALGDVNTVLGLIAALIAVVLGVIWWKTRRAPHETGGSGGEM